MKYYNIGITIKDGNKKDYIRKTTELLNAMPLYSYLNCVDRYNRHVSIFRNNYGYEIIMTFENEQLSKRTCATETARRLYMLDVHNKVGY